MNKKQAGSKGGKETVKRYGKEHMQQIGRRGAAVTWTRYRLTPWKQSQYAMVDRKTNEVKAIR